ncbi:MAG: glutamate--tRNA ligase [Legionellales bacterium]|nr:glutamate--tRNA ligase [Legionellales bacterium]
MNVKTRFAPSPTGYLHIGGARTALFAWLYAKNKKGKFVLRIEDTDLERSTDASADSMIEGLNWLGIKSDEQHVFQSNRLDRYQELLDQMIEKGLAYYCNCSKSRLDSLREKQLASKIKPKYDNCCREKNLTKSENTLIRFANPLNGKVNFDDLVFGSITVDNAELDDLVLQRSDGMPTYNFAAAVDDYDMGITHVIRGDDHINNTPKQINILKALGFKIPKFAHLPMILNSDGKRMSKRHDAVNIMQYKDEGILPEALLNYLVRLGWSHNDQEIFSVDEMIDFFNLSNVNKASATFNKDKLLWVNKHYLQNFEKINYINELKDIVNKLGGDINSGPSLGDVLPIFAKRADTLVNLAKDCLFLYSDQIEFDKSLIDEYCISGIGKSMSDICKFLKVQKKDDWSPQDISSGIKIIVKQNSLKFPQLAQPVRIALTGGINSPGIADVIFLLGKTRAIERVELFVEKISGSGSIVQ